MNPRTYNRLKEQDRDSLCPHCKVGRTSTQIGGFWCENPQIEEGPILPEPCTIVDWDICPLRDPAEPHPVK